MSDLTTAREYGRAGKTPLFWMANEPFASEYRRGEAERVPSSPRTPIHVEWEYLEKVGPPPMSLITKIRTGRKTLHYADGTTEVIHNVEQPSKLSDLAPSRAVPSLSGEFPGLGKWELRESKWYDDRIGVYIAGKHSCGGDYCHVQVDLDRIALSTNSENSFCATIPNWHTLLSALPLREVVGDYVVGPHGVKFQVEQNAEALWILGNGYNLIATDDQQIWIDGRGPLFDTQKTRKQQSWPLRGEA